jgi:hypothetical protein
MPQQQTHVRVVREWLVSLGVLSAVSISRQEADIKLAAFVPMLMREFPDAAFTPDSLAAVARQCKYFPTYGELCGLLSEWWRDNRPRPVAIAPPPPPSEPEREPKRPPPTPEEVARVHAVVTRLTAEWLAPPLYQTPLAPRVLSPAQLIEAYRNAKIPSPHGPAAAAPVAPAAPIDSDAATDAAPDADQDGLAA